MKTVHCNSTVLGEPLNSPPCIKMPFVSISEKFKLSKVKAGTLLCSPISFSSFLSGARCIEEKRSKEERDPQG